MRLAHGIAPVMPAPVKWQLYYARSLAPVMPAPVK